jgi:hypothetical protein
VVLLSHPHAFPDVRTHLRKTTLQHFREMSRRPTLPPLRTLGLPNPRSNLREQMAALRVNDPNDTYDSLVSTSAPHFRASWDLTSPSDNQPPMRNLSMSSSITNVSRSSNSPPLVTARTKLLSSSQHNVPKLSTNSNRPRRGYRLVLSTLDNADALLIVPDSGEQPAASGPDSENIPPKPKMGRGYLLVGEAMHLHLRQRKALRGARVHPYRFVSPLPRVERTRAKDPFLLLSHTKWIDHIAVLLLSLFCLLLTVSIASKYL